MAMPTRWRERLEALCRTRGPGPKPTFSIVHLLKAIGSIARAGQIGRASLARELGLGEGATRTLLDRLARAGLIRTSRRGCELTEAGRALWAEISEDLAWKTGIARSALALGEHNVAVLVRDRASKVRSGMEQRDAAVRAGARGAITMVFTGGRLAIPGISEDASSEYPSACKALLDALRPREGDVIIVCWADNALSAEYGALAAALSLL